MRTVVIVGVGLIGGSFAKALRAAGFDGRMIGVSSPPVLREALSLGIVDEAGTLEEAVPRADLVYLSQPILKIIETLDQLSGLVKPHTLVTDAGSTKTEIVRKAQAVLPHTLFLGGHPMAGRELRGVSASEADLFRDRTYLLCPSRSEDLQRPPAQAFVGLLGRIGAKVHIVAPEAHDRLVALTSHLPQLASTALASILETSLGEEDLAAAGPGLLDMTRLSLSPYEMWADILETNQQAIDVALERYISQLEQLRLHLCHSAAREIFAQGAAFRARLQDRHAK